MAERVYSLYKWIVVKRSGGGEKSVFASEDASLTERDVEIIDEYVDAVLCSLKPHRFRDSYRRELERKHGVFAKKFKKHREGWCMSIYLLYSINRDVWVVAMEETEPALEPEFILIVLNRKHYGENYVRYLIRSLTKLLEAGRLLSEISTEPRARFSLGVDSREILDYILDFLETYK